MLFVNSSPAPIAMLLRATTCGIASANYITPASKPREREKLRERKLREGARETRNRGAICTCACNIMCYVGQFGEAGRTVSVKTKDCEEEIQLMRCMCGLPVKKRTALPDRNEKPAEADQLLRVLWLSGRNWPPHSAAGHVGR